ncbi:L domain-like protein [Anaeromyces robustus]|uniref:L domain-like protein n=1 Tax=Anaeromyces robustus TaxID=1754192 RepID=A0A1Y1XLI2_9FUNG|nr:L domain-like protein [Anaeromyces robustus]|eukprot:ORX86581.1 L domain-like protein [Anaeromyces robustus]
MKLVLKALSFATVFLTAKASICNKFEDFLNETNDLLHLGCEDDASSLYFRTSNEVLLRVNDFPEIESFRSSLRYLEFREADVNQDIVDLICSFKNLQELVMQECDFDKNINWSCFENFKDLTHINIWDYGVNKMNQFPDAFYSLTSLKSLHIQAQNIPSLSDKIKNLKNLTTLLLDDNSIQEIPKGFCELKNLKKIDLTSNEIRELPDFINKLINLEIL